MQPPSMMVIMILNFNINKKTRIYHDEAPPKIQYIVIIQDKKNNVNKNLIKNNFKFKIESN